MANRLSTATSSYLRTAAHQPVHWLPWGAEAFEKAKRENKPILLDIGAVWCHWCHVMDHESYENPEIAGMINELYVPVKVDRDERPDVDARYQKAVAALTGQGGWPLTGFLTPDGEPFYGGTYFPPENRYGRPGFPHVLQTLARLFQEEPEKVRHQAEHLREALQRHAHRHAEGEVAEGTVAQGLAGLLAEFDAENGGFGGAPKFPHPGAHAFLLARARRTRDPAVLNCLDVTLTQMGNGGVYDQVGGGFHRYSVDAHWVVPHFEKMLYDNAELLKNYVGAYQATSREDFLAKARDIADWMESVLAQPRGGFGGSQDADVGPHDDGDYFTWTQDEAKAALDEEAFHLAVLHWDIEKRGEMHHNPGKNVLFVAAPPDALAAALHLPLPQVRDTLARARRQLREARAARQAPYVDPTRYANWNGMAIAAFLDLAAATGESRYRETALAALDLFLSTAYAPQEGFAHQVGPDGTANLRGLLDDNVQMADALLAAFNATQDPRYLQAARETGDLLLDRFFDDAKGALRDTARGLHATDGVAALAEPEHPGLDQATPAPNAVAVLVFDRLTRLTGDERYRAAGERILKTFASEAAHHGLFAGTLLLAMELHLHPPPDVLVLGPGDARADALVKAALAAHAPNVTLQRIDPAAPPAHLPEEARTRLAAVKSGEVAALVCEGFQCSAPIADPTALRARLTRPT